MSVLVVGMSHRSAPVALLERLSMDGASRDEVARRLVETPSLSEAMIISTCNRLEVYCVTNSFHAGVSDVVGLLAELSGVDTETLRGYLYVRYADAAAEHIMVVSSGLDSMVVGEQQIIGQVRTAYQNARGQGTVGAGLHALAQSALHAGKRVHTETEIDDAGASMVTFALDSAPDGFDGKTALVLGAGAMASLAATELGKRGIGHLIIANRTFERAERLCDHARQAGVSAEAIPFEQRNEAISRADVVVSATGADEFTVTAASIPADRAEQLMLIDLSLPRDIEDAAGELPGVYLVNIERLHKSVTSRESGSMAHRAAQEIIAEEVEAYVSDQRVRDVAPAVAALRRSANEIAAAELERLRGKLDDVNDQEFAEITKSVRRVVDKLLHEPTVQAKKLAAQSGTLSYETALQRLFGLESGSEPSPAVAVNASDLPDVVGKD